MAWRWAREADDELKKQLEQAAGPDLRASVLQDVVKGTRRKRGSCRRGAQNPAGGSRGAGPPSNEGRKLSCPG